MKQFKLLCLFTIMLFGFGCAAKPISIKPLDLDYALLTEKIDGECSICISEADLNSQVTEGMSDKYSYTPYSDFRFGLGYALKMSCSRVSFYRNKHDAIANDSQVIFVPKVITASESSFPFWPPDEFSFTLDTEVFGADGELIQTIQSTGKGTAENADWKESNGYAGSKAMERAIQAFIQQLDYNTINKRLLASPPTKTASIPSSNLQKVRKITQTIQLYQGTLAFPPPMWVNEVKDLGSSKYNKDQKSNTFTLEQIPKDQDFGSWQQIYGAYGFHLPNYDMKRFQEESINALTNGCKAQAKTAFIKAETDGVILTFVCDDLQDSLVANGNDTERGFLYMNQVDQSFAKVYMAWRAPRGDIEAGKGPLNKEIIVEALERLKTIRYQ